MAAGDEDELPEETLTQRLMNAPEPADAALAG
jgi:hypothetical protein